MDGGGKKLWKTKEGNEGDTECKIVITHLLPLSSRLSPSLRPSVLLTEIHQLRHARLEVPPSAAAVSNTLLSYRTEKIYDKWSQQTGLWFTSLSKHTVFTPGNQSINLFPVYVGINSLIQMLSDVHQQSNMLKRLIFSIGKEQ